MKTILRSLVLFAVASTTLAACTDDVMYASETWFVPSSHPVVTTRQAPRQVRVVRVERERPVVRVERRLGPAVTVRQAPRVVRVAPMLHNRVVVERVAPASPDVTVRRAPRQAQVTVVERRPRGPQVTVRSVQEPRRRIVERQGFSSDNGFGASPRVSVR